jgi:hypothetical protein
MVLGVFLRNAGRNRLGALKPAGSVKESALLATMQFKATLWATPLQIDPHRQDQGAGSTPYHLALSG